jgi:alkanesulfonate monooxygenase SsuD/methylene tetrahydromethanopterin reductase-like flavin-dependent oxidoreductase (luciferase family)
VRLGIHLPVVDSQGRALDAPAVMQRARDIEAAGFDSVWLGDHIAGRPDALMMLLVAAAATERLEVGTAILQLPLRNPVELAQRFLTLRALTRGRFSVGVGSGSAQRSFDAVGLGHEFENRFKTMASDLAIIRGLCRGEEVNATKLNPLPGAEGGPPLLIGAWASGIWVKKAALEYEGWMASGGRANLKTLSEGLKRYRDYGGKRALVATILVDPSQPEGPLPDDTPELRGDLEAIGRRYDAHNGFTLLCGPRSARERLERLAELGFDDALLVRRSGTYVYGDMTREQLEEIRDLLPRDARPPYRG